MNKHLICLGFAAIVGLASAVSAGDYSGGGNGTAEQPYRISTAADMNEIGAHPNDWSDHFVLTNNIDLSVYTGTEFNIIGTDRDNAFTGVFDGNSHTISNFTYTTTDASRIGLFGYVIGTSALIKNLTLVAPDVNAAGDSHKVASLVGGLEYGMITSCGIDGGSVSGGDTGDNFTGGLVGANDGTISNCYSSAIVSGYEYTGGLAGWNGVIGTILNCYATGNVTGEDDTGGLVGINALGTILNCYTTGNVTGEDYTGGLVGYNGGTISNCYAAGSVTGYSCTGGLVGESSLSTISNCYAAGSVTGTKYTGGLVGYNWGGRISNCYATGSVTGDNYTGGLVGCNSDGIISNCYAVGEVSASGASWQSSYYYEEYDNVVVNGMGYYCLEDHTSSSSFEDDLAAGYWKLTTGGLVGEIFGSMISASFWDVNSSGMDTSAGGEGKTTAEMMAKSTFTDAGWDFVGETINGSGDIWDICEGTNYPKLVWQIPAGDFLCGDGVNLIDYSFFAGHWLDDNCAGSADCEGADLDQSGTVDFNDIEIFADNWLEGL